LGLDDLYRNTLVLRIFSSSNIADGATARATRIDTTNLSINESMIGILNVGATNLAAATPGTVTVNFLQSPSTNASSYTHIAGSTMARLSPNTLAATPINATQRYIKGKYTVDVAGGTNLHFSLELVGTGRILPLTT
jgi:hypothetical protein